MKLTGFSNALVACLFTTALSTPIEILSSAVSGAFSFKLGDGTYYTPATPVVDRCFEGRFHGSSTRLPMTVLHTNETRITADLLDTIVTTYASQDDVWTEDFLTGALVVSAPKSTVLDISAESWLRHRGIKYFLPSIGMDVACLKHSGINILFHPPSWPLTPGPYVLSLAPTGNTVHQVYGLHRDNLEAFLFGVTAIPGASAYAPVELFIPGYQDAWIPVPSRLYSIGDDRPLAGVRVGLKDIYDLAGVQTGGGSRSYAEVYPAANATAVTMQKMLSLGAIIVARQNKDESIRPRRGSMAISRHIIRPDPDTCSDGIMILDMGTGGLPSYREQGLNSLPGASFLTVTGPSAGPTMPSNYLASTAGCPEIGIPVGQVEYQSYISLQKEMMPINVDLVAAPGCDGVLLEIVKRLTEKGVIGTVKVGRTAF